MVDRAPAQSAVQIVLFPLGPVPSDLIDFLAEQLAPVFAATVRVGQGLPVPDFAFQPKRRQYNSTVLLRWLRDLKVPATAVVLAVTEEDLYAEPLRFVFGEADPLNRRAIISLARLRTAYPGKPLSQALFRERAVKEAVHELGHVFGLRHCGDVHCVMHFSNSLFDTDVKSATFCASCKEKLKSKLDAAASSSPSNSTSSCSN